VIPGGGDMHVHFTRNLGQRRRPFGEFTSSLLTLSRRHRDAGSTETVCGSSVVVFIFPHRPSRPTPKTIASVIVSERYSLP
jgi:hypothetical protein